MYMFVEQKRMLKMLVRHWISRKLSERVETFETFKSIKTSKTFENSKLQVTFNLSRISVGLMQYFIYNSLRSVCVIKSCLLILGMSKEIPKIRSNPLKARRWFINVRKFYKILESEMKASWRGNIIIYNNFIM